MIGYFPQFLILRREVGTGGHLFWEVRIATVGSSGGQKYQYLVLGLERRYSHEELGKMSCSKALTC